jgi:hypothetical protein
MLIQVPPVEFVFINTAGTVVCKTEPGRLVRIIYSAVNTFTAIVYDGNPSTGKVISSISLAASDRQVGQFEYSCTFRQSLTIVTTGTPTLTVIFE